jgi:hypothetical protein
MADDDTEAGGKRRRPPTIDLKATEVASTPVHPDQVTDKPAEMSAAEPSPASGSATESASARAAADAKPEAKSGAKPTWLGTAPWSERLGAMRRDVSGRFDWRVLGAGAAGAAVTFLLFLAAYAGGAFTPPDTVAPVAARVASLENQVHALAARPQPAATDPRPLADLTARVSAAEQTVARLDAKLQSASAEPRPAQTDAALAARVAALEAVLRPLGDAGTRIDSASAAARDAKARADAAYATAEKSVQGVATAPNQKEIDDLSVRVAALEQSTRSADARITTTAGADKAGRLAFTAAVLRGAVTRGEPYARELGAVRPLLPDAKVLAALEPFAVTGVPSAEDLSRELTLLGPTMLALAGTPTQDSSLLGRLQSTGLVRIRPLSEAPGNDPVALIGRADVKATHGDIAGARADVASLPPAVQAPARGWIARVDARDAALATARSLAETAIGTLAK